MGRRLYTPKAEILLVMVITLLVAAPLQLWRIDQIPPALSHDEAAEGIDALHILKEGARPVFLPANNGREALFAYAMAFFFYLFGATVTAIRLTGAFFGIAAIPACYLMARTLYGQRVALFATLVAAISSQYLHLSRLGLRPIALPLFATLSLFFLWHGLKTGRAWAWVVAGVMLGLGLHTYLPARLLPLVLLVVVVLWLTTRRPSQWGGWREAVGRVSLLLAAALVVFAPLAYYFWQHPEQFLARAEQASVMSAIRVGANPVEVLLRNLGLALGMFTWRGDLDPRHNLPGAPLFDLFLAGPFFLGLVITIVRARRPECVTTLVWLAVMSIPVLLSDSAPHALRSIGMMPMVYVLPAIGLTAVWDWGSRGSRRLLAAAAIALVLVGSLLLTYRSYFQLWPGRADVARAFDADRVAMVEYLNSVPGDAVVYLTPFTYDYPTVAFLARRSAKLFDNNALPLPNPSGHDLIYLLGTAATEKLPLLKSSFPSGAVVHEATGAADSPLFVAYRVPSGTPRVLPAPEYRLEARLGASIELLGGDVEKSARAGEYLTVLLYWRALTDISADYTVFVHLVDGKGRVWAQRDHRPGGDNYPTTNWEAGEVVMDRYEVPIPFGTVPGSYQIRVGMYLERAGQRLPVLDASGQERGNEVPLAWAAIEKATVPPKAWDLAIAQPRGAVFSSDKGDGIRLLGYTVHRVARPGEAVDAVLFWQATADITGDYLVGLRLVDREGRILVEHELRPVDDIYPTTRWQDGEVVRDPHQLLLPADAPPGRATWQLALRESASPQSLRVSGANAQGNYVALGSLEILPLEHHYERPSVENPRMATLGDTVRLLGYHLDAPSYKAGARLRLTLYWEVLGKMDTSYTVFTHLLDAGEHIWGQQDSIPLGGTRPTTAWLPGEFFQDQYEFEIKPNAAPGTYLLEIGMYNAATGQRLPVYDEEGQPAGNRVILGSVQVTR